MSVIRRRVHRRQPGLSACSARPTDLFLDEIAEMRSICRPLSARAQNANSAARSSIIKAISLVAASNRAEKRSARTLRETYYAQPSRFASALRERTENSRMAQSSPTFCTKMTSVLTIQSEAYDTLLRYRCPVMCGTAECHRAAVV